MRVFTLVLLVTALFGCQTSDSGLNTDPKVGPPIASVVERDAWGQKKLNGIYQNTVKWLKQAPIVHREVGKIKSIAPIGTPNFQERGFSEGFRGKLTFEIIGEKNKAIFSGRGYMTNELSYDDPNGTLTIGNKRIDIHSSGLSMNEFNKPKIKIAVIKDYINRYYSPEFIGRAEPHFKKLAETYSEIGDYKNAIQNLKSAKAGFLKNNVNAVDSPGTDREFIGLNKRSSEELREYLRQEALYYYYSGNLNQVSKTLKQVLQTPFLASSLNTDNLWLWVVQSRSGKQELANHELRKSMQLAVNKQELCWMPFAKFLVGDLNEQEFISYITRVNRIASPDCGNVVGEAGLPIAYYYSAQKQFVNKNTEKSKALLHKFLSANAWDNKKFEKSMATYELKHEFNTEMH
jgi:tetratricopeptide (TPR) repeat protein